ncbi:MAG: 6-phosphogluconolactonase, partial [Gemmatimonadales bacterium]
SRVEWSRVQILGGDERCVPPDLKESIYRLARETLLDLVPVPAATVHRIRGEDDPVAAAGRYEATLRMLFQAPVGPAGARPGASIDLILLGLGGDGHTASLFPGSAAVRERTRWVTAERAAATSLWRVTLTPAVINAAVEVLFLVSGSAKARILRRVLEGPRHPAELPAQVVAPVHGRVHWLVDAAAASELGKRP